MKPMTYCFAYFIVVSTGILKLRQITNQSSIGSAHLQVITYPTQGEGHQTTTLLLKDSKASYMMIVHATTMCLAKLLKKLIYILSGDYV